MDEGYNGNIDTNAKYVGFMYEDSGLLISSDIKMELDEWYEENLLTEYASYLEDTIFCNDRTRIGGTTKVQIMNALEYEPDFEMIAYDSLARVLNSTPSLSCSNNADAFTVLSNNGNGNLTYPIGLLTMDEIWLSGIGRVALPSAYDGLADENNYLYTDFFNWWSMTPYDVEYNSPSIWGVKFNGNFDYFDSGNLNAYTNLFGVRPVVSLKPGLEFEYGNGTVSNPYRFISSVS